MPDPADPIPPPAPAAVPEPQLGGDSTSTGLPSNVAAAIACIPLIGGIIFYILEKRDSFVRFYAMQSIIFGGAWFLFNIVSAIVHAVFGRFPALAEFSCFFWSVVGRAHPSGISGRDDHHHRQSVHQCPMGHSPTSAPSRASRSARDANVGAALCAMVGTPEVRRSRCRLPTILSRAISPRSRSELTRDRAAC